MSGLRSRFARPRKTNGATANAGVGDRQTPMESFSFSSPAAGGDVSGMDFNRSSRQSFRRQDRARFNSEVSATPMSFGFSPVGGGRQSKNARLQDSRFSMAPYIEVPDPCITLQRRLSLASCEAVKNDSRRKCRMKSVDETARAFPVKYFGEPGEDWIHHLDSLEIHRANKFQWSAREFYYALQHTLGGIAKETLGHLERDVETFDFRMYLPNWFQTEGIENRELM